MSDGMTDMMREERARRKPGDGCLKSSLLTELYHELRQVQEDVKELKIILNSIIKGGSI
ncbi:MAG: hypothetical protein LBC59_09335 [Chitinispirillales bacterium]|nr:hypothetical protein [Chitinispirillales bacterium]